MWTALLDRMLDRLFRTGTITIDIPGRGIRRYGDGTGDPVAVTIHDPDLARRLVLNPELAAGEGYVDEAYTIGNDDLHGLLRLAIVNIRNGPPLLPQRLASRAHDALRWTEQINPASRAKANVAHHYDLSGALYDLFLDRDRQYSCAYFMRPDMTLEEAQEAKKAHIAAKLRIEPGMHVLDIGCGWGGMALTLAREHGAQVTGITLSEEQIKVARARAEAEGLASRVTFRLCDYRDLTGTFDRIVSVGMFEHVGLPQYRTFFRTVSDRLAPDGVALIHTIGRIGPPGATSPWIAKYIFPGGYVPALSEMSAAVEHEWLYPTDVEIWRLHYAETLRHWYDRFVARQDAARALYDDAVLPDVALLSRGVRDGVPPRPAGGVPGPARASPGRGADHPRLPRPVRARRASPRRRVTPRSYAPSPGLRPPAASG